MRLIDADRLLARTSINDADFRAMIEYVPTVNPVPVWTPCSDGMPEDERLKLVTVKLLPCFEGDNIPSPDRTVFEAYYKNGRWFSVWDLPMTSAIVLAWQPLTEPYNPDHVVDPNKKVDPNKAQEA